jgi:hypothetical protein
MPNKLTRGHVFYAFEPGLQPAMHVEQGEQFTLETHDRFAGQLKTENDLLDTLD